MHDAGRLKNMLSLFLCDEIKVEVKIFKYFAKVFKHVHGNSLTFPSSIFLAHKSFFLLIKEIHILFSEETWRKINKKYLIKEGFQTK